MSELSTHQLTHPKTLTEEQLLSVLRNVCIHTEYLESLNKQELVKVYKKTALPRPQRKHGNRIRGGVQVEMEVEENSEISVSSTDEDETSCCSWNCTNEETTENTQASSQVDRLKPPVNEVSSASNVRLSNSSKEENERNGLTKRKNDEKPEDSSTKKRQKITWP